MWYKIKSYPKYKSVCGRVVKSSGFSPSLTSLTALSEVRFPTVLDSPAIFSLKILNWCTVYQLFIADLLYFIISGVHIWTPDYISSSN